VAGLDAAGARSVIRSAEKDMFRLGTDEADRQGYERGYERGYAAGLAAAGATDSSTTPPINL
jgi:coenzyme F420-0:L-glutamate ligase/coenzyme F420-1:gamma-L-glutamate ligase